MSFAHFNRHLVAAASLIIALAMLAPGASNASAAGTTYYVAPAGSGSSCGANSQANPFATIQTAVACAADGDVISLAPTGPTPYPGVGTVGHSVSIVAQPGADARSVKIDAAEPDGNSGELVVAPDATVIVRGISIDCVANECLNPNITNNGTLELRGVTVSGAAFTQAIINLTTTSSAAHLTVAGSTIAHNTNAGFNGYPGAGIFSGVQSGGLPLPTVSVSDSTISDNTNQAGTSGLGAGIATNGMGQITLLSSTITDNHVIGSIGKGAGIYDPFTGGTSPISASNTIIAGSTAATNPDCSGRLADGPGGHNLIGIAIGCTGPTDGVNGDLVGVANTGLGVLADNGGPTDTVTLQPQSPAIGHADSNACRSLADVDQRGYARTSEADGCDIGSYEAGAVAPVASGTPDHAAPSVSIAAPSSGATYIQGDVVSAEFTCSDTASGVAACAGDVTSGAAIDTTTTGTHAFTVTGTDNASNERVKTVDYTVVATPVSPAPRAQSADLSLSLKGFSKRAEKGALVEGTLIAANEGPDDGSASVELRIAGGHPVSTDTCRKQGSIYVCLLPAVKSGAQVKLPLAIKASRPGRLRIRARIVGTLPDPTAANDTAQAAVKISAAK